MDCTRLSNNRRDHDDMVSTKRRRHDNEEEGSPRKVRAHIADDEATGTEPDAFEAQTPSRSARFQHLTNIDTPKSILKKTGAINGINAATPKSNRKLLFETPTKSGDRD